jgi:hypothetical protein
MRLSFELGTRSAVRLGTAGFLLSLNAWAAVAAPHERPASITPPWHTPASATMLDEVRERASDVSAAVEMTYEPRLVVYQQQVDYEAVANADAVAHRLAREFGLSPKDVAAARATCDSWGELTIAFTLRSAVDFPVTPGQLATIHRDLVGWARIAHGLGLDIESFAQAAEAATDVAAGWSDADGRVPFIGPAGARNTAMQFDP